MKDKGPRGPTSEHLYLELTHHSQDLVLPLHTSVVLFLLSYCDCTALKVVLVPEGDIVDSHPGKRGVPQSLAIDILSHQELPAVVQSCRLPALVEKGGNFCRAGLAVTLRHIVQGTCNADPSRKDVAELLGFKKTCLKACAEVSHWTRLCEISIPLAVEAFLETSPDQRAVIPPEILHLERKLGEPVRVHNDDKIRRQKLLHLSKAKGTQPTASTSEGPHRRSPERKADTDPDVEKNQGSNASSVELSAALSKLSVEPLPSVTTREPSCIRKVKTVDLPALEHVFAEGLFFTLTDLVLLPCLHYYFVALGDRRDEVLSSLPLLSHWYQRVQEIPGVKRAAASCEIHFLNIPTGPMSSSGVRLPSSSDSMDCEPGSDDLHFRGGPRPTMSKLEENGISAKFTPHPCPSWSLDWSSLPVAVNPTEGKLPCERAVRKQQQLNSLVSVVTSLARPGDTIVDFCSGGGHVAIVLAHTLPSCQIVLVENKEESLLRAKDRCEDLRLNNIWFIQANLDSFKGLFKIGVGLHACGVATDMVIDRCIKARASFVICPCCYGFIQNTVKFTFPRSQKFKDILSYKEHMVLSRFADQTAVQLPGERRIIGKNCMGLVDLDRAWAAEEHDYKVFVTSMEPESCSPKNNLIVGRSPSHDFKPNAVTQTQ
ncbi:glutathione S-transferase C-terminal domain-containing protein [Callorhinchus milii]|uniref:glutathione S-transferase C-terminal domain-containing protein n=1 Tax=Callorhinchus milii TaxID=7868 RepID=UPI001C3F76BF|nr:glutathione S-transferase C-terminal domain-containing protein [Callorhinchus milii]